MKNLDNKINRFTYLSDYYIQLLKARKAFEDNSCANISIDNQSFNLGKVKGADNIIKNDFPRILENMTYAVENELSDFFNKIIG